jgi:hypothetical protein
VALGAGVAVRVRVGLAVGVSVGVGVDVSLGVPLDVGVAVASVSTTTTSSSVAPQDPDVVLVKSSRVTLPVELAGSAVPRLAEIQPMFCLVLPVVSNWKRWLVLPKVTVSVLTGGVQPGLPARAKLTLYTCPGWVGTF